LAEDKDKFARALATLGFVVSLVGLCVSGFTLYWTSLRPACLRVAVGPKIFLALKPRIGVLVTLTNEGARQIVVTSGQLQIAESILKLTTTASESETWEYSPEGDQKTRSVRYAYFTPFAVKAHDQATASLWFVAGQFVRLQPGRYPIKIVLNDADNQEPAELHIEIELSQTDIDLLYRKGEKGELPGVEFPIEVKSQSQINRCTSF